MIIALHAATGAATGALTGSRLVALAVAPVLHIASDRVPHRHPAHDSLDYLAGALAIGILARRRGAFDVATIGAVAAILPDVEHVVPGVRPRGAKLFHRRRRRVRRDVGLSAGMQMLLAASVLGPLIVRRCG
jgi:hypothetical protein